MSRPRENNNNNNNNTHTLYTTWRKEGIWSTLILSNQLQMLFLVSMQEGEIWEVSQIMGKIFPTLPHERKLSTNI